MNKITNIKKSILLFIVLLAGCKSPVTPVTQAKISNTGNLFLVANGEDFVRQGFLTKDGWEIEFDRLEVSVSEVIAYNTNSETKSNLSDYLKSQPQVLILDQATTIDLAAGDDNATPIPVTNKEVTAGFYNALSWKMQPTETGLFPDNTIVLQGKAIRLQRNVNFLLGFRLPLQYYCGDFVGNILNLF